jgi:dienelactone hydrolase
MSLELELGLSAAQEFLFGHDPELPLDVRISDQSRHAGYRELRLSYASSSPARVPAVLTLPLRDGPWPAVIVQHGGGQSREDPLLRSLMRRWSAAGFACFAIDAPGHGERAVRAHGARGRAFFEYLRSRLMNVIDLRHGIDLLAESGADVGRIGYWGVSMGGGIGVMLMAADPRVRAACLCLAGARARRDWPAAVHAAADFAALHADPLALAPLLAGREVLMLNGSEDSVVPREDAERLFHALPEPKAQHWFRTGHKVTPAMLRQSREFLERTLSG